MVTISNYQKRQGEDGKDFFTLQLQGDVEFVFSQKTGLPYATARTCSIPTTFDEVFCTSLIGNKMPGSIKKVQLEESYDYAIPQTGEVVSLDYRFVYSPLEDNMSMEEAVFHKEPVLAD